MILIVYSTLEVSLVNWFIYPNWNAFVLSSSLFPLVLLLLLLLLLVDLFRSSLVAAVKIVYFLKNLNPHPDQEGKVEDEKDHAIHFLMKLK